MDIDKRRKPDWVLEAALAEAPFTTWVWDPAVGDDLHQQDTKGPDV